MPEHPDSMSTGAEDLAQIGRLRFVSIIEASTLVILLLVAVPLKHAFGYPLATRVMGPVHGAAFVAYAWITISTVSGGGWRRVEIARLIAGALVPFGGFLNAGMLRRKRAAIVSGRQS